ncbi:homeobox protein rough [Caerostris darwini]|uniref:Homeobox protein rough n=1 Tax=Caerostris darwini TaxID=1538125 RepID=A0AAV4U579_9ARAC|nr:homeobox protein rough [Caerostris darwini]
MSINMSTINMSINMSRNMSINTHPKVRCMALANSLGSLYAPPTSSAGVCPSFCGTCYYKPGTSPLLSSTSATTTSMLTSRF